MTKRSTIRVHRMSDAHSASGALHLIVGLIVGFIIAAFSTPGGLDAQSSTRGSGGGTASATVPVLVGLDSRIWVDGTSTVRDFTCEAGVVAGTVRARAGEAPLSLEGLSSAVTRAELQIPAGQMDCSNGTMNDHMWEALKVEEHQNIRFTLRDYRITGTTAGSASVELTGTLSLAGVSQMRTISAEAIPQPDGTLRVTGSTTFNQSEHNIKPPSLFFGTMKVRDPVTVSFDLVLAPQQPAAQQ